MRAWRLRRFRRMHYDIAAQAETWRQDLQIRQLRQSDSDAVRELDELILGADRSKTWATYMERFLAVSELDALPHPPWGCFVAEGNGEIVGFLLAERQSSGYGLPPGARVVALTVRPDMQRRGLGKRLIDALAGACRSEGIERIYSVLRAEDERDAAFLTSCEFETASVRVFSRKV